MIESTLQRIAAGDGASVQECLDRYGGLVWSIARRLAPTAQDAEDAVQEIFLDVWRNAGRFDPEIGSEATFIATIARRRLLDQRRRASRRLDPEPLVSEDAVSAPTAVVCRLLSTFPLRLRAFFRILNAQICQPIKNTSD